MAMRAADRENRTRKSQKPLDKVKKEEYNGIIIIKRKEITMEIMFDNINLTDKAGSTGGKSWNGETLAEFIKEDEMALTLADINRDLESCGIEPITLDQIVITGIRGE